MLPASWAVLRVLQQYYWCEDFSGYANIFWSFPCPDLRRLATELTELCSQQSIIIGPAEMAGSDGQIGFTPFWKLSLCMCHEAMIMARAMQDAYVRL